MQRLIAASDNLFRHLSSLRTAVKQSTSVASSWIATSLRYRSAPRKDDGGVTSLVPVFASRNEAIHVTNQHTQYYQ